MATQLYPRLRIFVSSSYSELENEREMVQIVCEDLGIDLFLAPEKSLAGTGAKAYLKELREQSSVMILLLAERVSDFVDEEIAVARENGIPILPFFKLIKRADGHDLSDAAQAFRERHPMVFSAKFRNLLELREQLQKGLSNILATRFDSTMGLCGWSPQVYRQSRNLISDSYWRLMVIENTASLILGPRTGNGDESRFVDTLRRRIETVVASKSSFILYYLFSAVDTEREWASGSYSKQHEAKRWFLDKVGLAKGDPRIKFASLPQAVSSCMVGDYSYGISIDVGHRLYTFGYEQHKIANELFDIGQDLYERHHGHLHTILDGLG